MKQAYVIFLVFLMLSTILFAQTQRDVKQMLSFPHRADNMFLRFQPGTAEPVKQMIFQELDATVVKAFTIVSDLYLVQLGARMNLASALERGLQNENVMYVEPNYTRQIVKGANDPKYLDGTLWGLDKISCPAAWETATDSTVIVAVIDTGVQTDHPDLAANMWVNTAEQNGTAGVDDDANGLIDDIHGYDFANNTGDVTDDYGHGTHVAGIIGAVGNNSLGLTGVCWKVQIMALRVSIGTSGFIDTDAVISSLQYAGQKGVKAVNMSFGGTSSATAERDAIAALTSTVCAAAAGNDSTNNDVLPFYPANYGLPNLIAVASSDELDGLSSFSNYGPTTIHLMAPGSNIYSTVPTDDYDTYDGTSMATPHVVGAAALLCEVFPTLTPTQIIAKILQNVDVIAGGNAYVISGGRLNLQKAIVDTEEEMEDFGRGSGGCSSFPFAGKETSVLDLLPYVLLALLFVCKKRSL